MNLDINRLKEDVFSSSEIINNIKKLKDFNDERLIFGEAPRKLSDKEINTLVKHGNYAEDWEKIRVVKNFRTDFIINNSFYGEVFLGFFSGKPVRLDSSLSLPSGIYRSTIIDSTIGKECLIYNNGIISNYCIMDNAVITGVNSLSAADNNIFGNGIQLNVGIETGGREILLFPEMSMPLAEALAAAGSKSALFRSYSDFIKSYIEKIRLAYGVVEPEAIIMNTSKIEDSYIGNSAIIDNALLVKNSTILSNAAEKTEISHGSIITDSIIQWGAKATKMAIVSNSVLSEYSSVENHGKVNASIIGPNSGIAKGEISASLVGPFVGFHHQAMLIAALWPRGKGNIGYGANIGSNHTSKSPDQELLCGEGIFFGLGVNIKYPSDLTEADYTVIATGVDTLPQRLEFPFSLINKPSIIADNISPAYNEIHPAWVLSDNLYAILRNEAKYRKRDKSTRLKIEYNVFRPDIIEKMIRALDSLKIRETKKEIYTENDIKGLGKNFMTEDSRIKAVKTYNLFIEYYALKGLMKKLTEIFNGSEKIDIKEIYSYNSGDLQWELQKKILNQWSYDKKETVLCLNKLIELIDLISEMAFESKRKDDVRGERIIKNYCRVHTEAAEDLFLIQFKEEMKKYKSEIFSIIEKIS